MSFPISRRISLLVRFVPSAFRLSVFKSVSCRFGPSSASSSGYALRIEQVSGQCQTPCPLRKKCWQRRPDCRTNDLNASLRIVQSKRPIVRQPTLFELGKVPEVTSQLKIDRPYSLPGILLGTSAFTANGWQSSFYPAGMKPVDYLKFYSTKFQTVEVDSTFYGTPSAATVEKWSEKTPPDFVFTAKVPQLITHEKVLVDCDAEWKNFLGTMEILGEKLGPLLFQFGHFNNDAFKSADEFL